MFCNKCGAELPEGASFCTSCGTRQNTSTESTTTVESTPSSSADSSANYTYSDPSYSVEPPVKPKKKRVALKVILALILILVIGTGVTVLGYYTFLPAKTTLQIAQYTTVLNSYNTFDKRLTQLENKFYKPYLEDTVKNQSEISLSFDDAIWELSGLDTELIALVEEGLKNLSFTFDHAIDAKNEKQTLNLGINYMRNPILSANLYLNGSKFGLGVPELVNKTITGDLSNLDNLTNLFPDLYEEDVEFLENMDPWLYKDLYEDIKPDRKAIKSVMHDFSKTLVNSIDSSDMSIKRGKTTELFGEKVKCQEITIKLDQKAQKKLISNLLTMMKDNQDFYDLTIGNMIKLFDILAQNPMYAEILEGVDLSDVLSKSNYKAALLELKNSLDEDLFPEKITAKVYIQGLHIVKYEISLFDDEESSDNIVLTIEQVNDGLSYKTNVTLTCDVYGEIVDANFTVIKDHDDSSDTSDLQVDFNFNADTYDFVGNINVSIDSKEKLQGKNEVAHDITVSIKAVDDTYGYGETVEISADISGTKMRNNKHLTTESSYKGNMMINVPEELDSPLGFGFAVNTETTYGEKVEIPAPDKVLDLSAATQDDLDDIVYEIYEKLGLLSMMLGGF